MKSDPKTIADIAKLYHEIKTNQQNLYASAYQGSNGVAAEKVAKEKLRYLLESYKRQVSPEIREELDVDVSEIERLIS
jgi:hypothetical protein